jgi:hypothetical protein
MPLAVPPEDEAEEEAMFAAAMKASLQQAASDAVAQDGDSAILPARSVLAHVPAPPPSGEEGRPLAIIRLGSEVDFYYYGCEGVADLGWGCSYRCCQMIVSSAAAHLHRSSSGAASAGGATQAMAVPTIVRIQECLASLPGRPFTEEQVGSTTWIEPPDVGAFLRAHHIPIASAESEVRVADVTALSALCAELWGHFGHAAAEPWRAPVMIDDSMFSYCICGVAAEALEAGTEETWVLVLDPHVSDPTVNGRAPTGITAEHIAACDPAMHKATSSLPAPGLVRWRRFREVFVDGARGSRWMICCPASTPRPPTEAAVQSDDETQGKIHRVDPKFAS